MTFFDIKNIAIEAIGNQISYVELIGTLFRLLSVDFAPLVIILTWTTRIINELFLFILLFQVQVYADIFLQVYFFVVTFYGWYNWKQKFKQNSISPTECKTKIWFASAIIVGTIIVGLIFTNAHLYLPNYFKPKAAFLFADSFVIVFSILATVLLAHKKIESWHLWIVVDIVWIFLFFKKRIAFLTLEYLFFLGLPTYGLLNCKKHLYNG